MPTFPLQSIDVHFTETGNGPPALFLHGVPDTLFIWEKVISQLSGNFRCLATDWPGFGGSGAADSFDFSLEGHAEIVREMADALGLEKPFPLISHDFGGISAMAFAAKYPTRLSHLVISNAPFSPDYRWHPWAQIWRTPLLGELSTWLMNPLLFKASMRRGARLLDGAHLDQTYRNIDGKMKQAVLKLYRSMDPSGFTDWLPRLQQATKELPTLVLWGEQDPYIPKWMAATFGEAEVQRFPQSGHWLPAEMPAEFSKHVLELLRQS